jgi:SAM-dependent methyltransferase
MIWLWLESHDELIASHPTLLHIAPEVSLMRHFKRHYKGFEARYITADLESPLATLHFDVQSIPMDDCSVDAVICNHLFEHVEDDIRAMREIYRIMRPGGWGIMLVPEDRSRATTFEDDTITDRESRTRLFGQYDHRRVYGRDYDTRLEAAGFRVQRITPSSWLTAEQQRLHGTGHDDLVVVYKD